MVAFISFVFGFLFMLAALVLMLYKLGMKFAWVFAPSFVNDPKNPNKFSLFTAVGPGEIKVVVRGDSVVGYIMNTPEKTLQRNKNNKALTINNEAYAEVVEETADTVEDDLFDWSDSKYRPWGVEIFRKCGLVFVGIPPWQTLGTRPFRSAHLSEDRKSITYTDGVTDHMRVREFARPFIVRLVETVEGLKTTVGIEITFETVNGFKQWHTVDRFEVRLDNIVPARMQEFIKTQPIERIVTADDVTRRTIEEYLIGTPDGSKKGVLEEALSGYGLRAKKAHVFDLEPELTDAEKEAFTAEWRAVKRKKARAHDAEADRDYLEKTSAPLKDNEGLVRVEIAKAAAGGKGTTTIIDRGGGTTDLAALAELQRIRGNKGGESK